MKRAQHFDFIESQLSFLAYRIEVRGSLNILDLNLQAESFYLHFFNLLFAWDLKDLNQIQHNRAGLDLVDTTKNIVIQVSATATKQKIESALGKDLSDYKGYSFKFISISKNAKDLRTKTFTNPHGLVFSPAKDIFDIPSILRFIKVLKVEKLEEIRDFLEKELKKEPASDRVESNLTTIIKILSKENWSQEMSGFETVPYDVEAKVLYNQLSSARVLIDDFKIHYPRIEKIYSIFNRQGENKSLSILNGIRTEYLALVSTNSPDQLFLLIIKKVIQKIRMSANYTLIPDEELELCVQILVVDAFIRCKIFKNPSGNRHAYT